MHFWSITCTDLIGYFAGGLRDKFYRVFTAMQKIVAYVFIKFCAIYSGLDSIGSSTVSDHSISYHPFFLTNEANIFYHYITVIKLDQWQSAGWKIRSKSAAVKQIRVVEKLGPSSAALAFCLLLVTPKIDFGYLNYFIIGDWNQFCFKMCPGIPKIAVSHYFCDIPVFDETKDLKSGAPMCDSNGSLYNLNWNTGLSWKTVCWMYGLMLKTSHKSTTWVAVHQHCVFFQRRSV